jgi:hypothetical protein
MNAKSFVLGIALIILCVLSPTAFSATKTSADAASAVKGWLKLCNTPLSSKIGSEIGEVVQFNDPSGIPLYYAVQMKPSGFVIVSADDSIEPIIAFGEKGKYSCNTNSALYALLANNLMNWMSSIYLLEAGGVNGEDELNLSAEILAVQNKWNCLIAASESTFPMPLGLTTIDDIRVPQLVQSKWDQDNVCSNPEYACYNYYTPKWEDSTSNYPCGCVATAMAQYMRFHQFPIAPVNLGPFNIQVNGIYQQRTIRGGDGSGGPYQWTEMVLDPANSCGTLTQNQRAAIGALTHDAGVSIQSSYSSSITTASTANAGYALVEVFGYHTATWGGNGGGNIGAGLDGMIIPNLDMINPVLLAVDGVPGSHAVVCDGYGYNMGTLYYHINLGWSGTDDAWFNLPTIETNLGAFSVVHTCVYNIYITGDGELISGRIIDASGYPYSDATVRATRVGGGIYEAISSGCGTYAIKVPSNSTYNVTVVSGGNWKTKTATTMASSDQNPASGNVYGIDFLPMAVVENPGTIWMTEGQTAQFGVKLNQNPEGTVTVNVTGNSSIQIQSPASGVLTFNTSNWNTYQNVTLLAVHDQDANNGGGFYGLLSAAGWTCPATVIWIPDDDKVVLTDVDTVNVPEGSTATFRVRLQGQPSSNVTVAVARSSGDTDVSVQSGASLTFTNLNWNNYQTVTLAAAEDADGTNGSATISCTSTSWTGKDVTATEMDNDPDSDGDGLPDDWEMDKFGDLDENGTGDYDGDGRSNYKEWVAGTDPTDPLSFFSIPAVTKENNGTVIVFQWSSISGKLYRVQFSDDIFSGSMIWHTAEENIPASGTGTNVWYDDGSMTGIPPNEIPRRYYRVEVYSQ